MAKDTTIAFRVNRDDFDSDEQYEWFLQFHQKRDNKSEFYRKACLPKLKLSRVGQEDNFNKLIQMVEVLGLDHIIECVEGAANNRGGMDEAQILTMVNQILRSVEAKGGSIGSAQQQEIVQDLRTPNKDKTSKLLKLSQ
ncbi:hypothetical protein MKY96_33405 [Paenibacillus sp. FSL R7-0302]|uniref:hypothetical protein n=1 Tax=Paenibacillus sp. FSL R7-0302 TaxID=2921681 RepID=UPI0030F4D86F